MKDNSNITQELLETVERYYNDSMPIEERSSFEIKLKSDETFNSLVEDIKTLLLGIESQSLKEQLDEFHKDIPLTISKKTSPKVKVLQLIKYAVAAVIVIALGSYWLFGKPSNEKLYAKYFTPDPGLPTTMSATDNFEFYDAMVNYKHSDYDIAIKKWTLLIDKKPHNDTLTYFLGVAHLANKNENKAINFLSEATESSESVFLNEAYYYLGLAYLKANKKEDAIKYLKLTRVEKSIELLDKLK